MQKTKNRIYLILILLLVIALCVGGFILFTKGRGLGRTASGSTVSGQTETSAAGAAGSPEA